MVIETRVAQKEKLYALLVVKRAYKEADIQILPELENGIEAAMAAMDDEDILHVEKRVWGSQPRP